MHLGAIQSATATIADVQAVIASEATPPRQHLALHPHLERW